MELLPINKNNKVKALLVLPENVANNLTSVITNYLSPLGEHSTEVLVASVFVPKKGVLKKDIFLKEWGQIQEVIETYGIEILGVASTDYFNKILKAKKKLPFERLIGEAKEADGLKITPILNYYAINISPNKKHLLQKSIDTLKLLLEGKEIENKSEFLNSLDINLYTDFYDVKNALKELLKYDKIAVDIETTGLFWYKDELLTISFSTSETEGFSVALFHKYTKHWKHNREIVKKFFEKYNGKVILHNAQFDIPFLVYNFWMDDITDTKNMIKGVNQFDIEDTMIMTYLCLNSVDRPKLSLKDLAYSKYGSWDSDIDQSKLSSYTFDKVGKYNTIDTCATMFIYNEYLNRLEVEDQKDLYLDFYKRFIPAVIKMKMNGLTIDKDKLLQADKELEKIYNENLEFLLNTYEVKETERILKEIAEEKGKRQSEIDKIKFNPKSTNHLRVLLFDVLGFTPEKFSKKTGEPSTDKEVLSDLFKQCQEGTIEYDIIKALKEIGEMKVVYSTFIKGFENLLIEDKKGNVKIFGNFNITGTLSGRMSSNNPNLLNIPSNSRYGKLIKSMIIGNNGKIIAQADFSALEDRVGANVTNDPNKIKVFVEGFDGHSLAASYYFEEQLKERGINVDKNNPNSVNKIKELAPDLRQIGKAVTFGANYGATEHSVSRSLKISLDDAKEILDKYWEMYSKTKEYWNKVENFALENGYVVGALGLKSRVNLGQITNNEAYSSTLRSIVNMTIQSYALLMNRTIFKLQEEIEKNGYEEDVLIQNSVYDSIYIMIKPEPKIIKWLNNTLVDIMLWLPDYAKNWKVKNEAELEIGKSWVTEEELPNGADLDIIKEKLDKVLKE